MHVDLALAKREVFSELLESYESYPLHERAENLHFDFGLPSGAGTIFNPLPGFLFGSCGPLELPSLIRRDFLCDLPVISAILFLEGHCCYRLRRDSEVCFELQKNMFIVGNWQDQEMEITIPRQSEYTHVGILVEESAIEAYFGRGARADLNNALGLAQSGNSFGVNTISGIASPEVITAATQVLAMQKENGLDFLRYRCAVLDLFAKLLQNTAVKDSPAILLHEQDRKRLAEFKATIEKDFLSMGSAVDVCTDIGMSFSKANKAFKSLYSTTIAQYIQQCKMSYAYSMLLKRKFTVSECAFSVGYSNISHFISAFKKYYGMTPKTVSRLNANSPS